LKKKTYEQGIDVVGVYTQPDRPAARRGPKAKYKARKANLPLTNNIFRFSAAEFQTRMKE